MFISLCLCPKVKLLVVEHFIKNPDLRQNQTQLSKSIKVPQNTVGRHISELVQLQILNEEQYGKSVVYSLNKTSLIVNQLLMPIITLESHLLPQWITRQMSLLSKEARTKVEKIILFGSAARNELKATSDIDLIAILSKHDQNIEFELHTTLVAGGSAEGLSINLQIETRKKFDSTADSHYLKEVRLEGIVLWARKQNANHRQV